MMKKCKNSTKSTKKLYVMVSDDWSAVGKIRIGASGDLTQRRRSLSKAGGSSPAHVYACVDTPLHLPDNKLKNIIKILNADALSSSRRDFYRLSKEQGADLIRAAAEMWGTESTFQLNPLEDSYFPAGRPGRRGMDMSAVPDGVYMLAGRTQGEDVSGKMKIKAGKCLLLAGAKVALKQKGGIDRYKSVVEKRRANQADGAVTKKNIEFKSPSEAACYIFNGITNGLKRWKDSEGRPLSFYRKHQ